MVPNMRDWLAKDWAHKLALEAETTVDMGPVLACAALATRLTFLASTAQPLAKDSLVSARSSISSYSFNCLMVAKT